MAADVLAGKTFSNSTGSGLTGTMVNRGKLNWNPTSNTTQTVQPGYYSGGTLNSAGAYNKGKTDGAAASKVGTATAGQVLSGKTFTNSTTVGATGTMPNKGAWTNAPTAKGKVTIPAGYHNGSGYVDTSGVYAKGYTDGKAEAVGSANITYTYHNHIGSKGSSANGCYTTPVYSSCTQRGSVQLLAYDSDNHAWFKVCPVHGRQGAAMNDEEKDKYIEQYGSNPVCGLQYISSYDLGCGKTTSTVESATIKY